MADIKTLLRELSVVVGLEQHKKSNPITYSMYKREFFVGEIEKLYDQQFILRNLSPIVNVQTFSVSEEQIIQNGFNLANKIASFIAINKETKIEWLGFDNHIDEPYDIKVDCKYFSLKEESYILENMGLYKMINLLTGKSLAKGVHIFKEYAPKEFNDWFEYSWSKLVEQLNANQNKKIEVNSDSYIELIGEHVVLNYKGASKNVPKNTNVNTYEARTTSTFREKVFSKWLKTIERDPKYISIKKHCAITAGQNLVNYINDNLNEKQGLARFLRIHKEEYYYAKTTLNNIEIFKVPGLNNFEQEIIIESISASIPTSQLNIITKIKNVKTSKILELRNELRYSHGQLNGTPEAKLYYAKGISDLSVIYQNI